MSLEAIKVISQAEEKAKQAKADAVLASKKTISEAEAAGRQVLEQAKAKAAQELEELEKRANDNALEQAKELAASTENKMASMRVRAESSLEKAADLIVERIVNS